MPRRFVLVVQVQVLPPSDVARFNMPLVMPVLTVAVLIFAVTVMEVVVWPEPEPNDTVEVYLPAWLPMTSDASNGQVPLSEKYSASGVLALADRLTASDTWARAM